VVIGVVDLGATSACLVQAQRDRHILIFGVKNDAHLYANAGLAAEAAKCYCMRSFFGTLGLYAHTAKKYKNFGAESGLNGEPESTDIRFSCKKGPFIPPNDTFQPEHCVQLFPVPPDVSPRFNTCNLVPLCWLCLCRR